MALLIAKGQRLAVADSATLSRFRLERRRNRFFAELVVRHTLQDRITALAEGPAALLVAAAVHRTGTRLHVFDGHEVRPLAAVEGTVADLAIARRTVVIARRTEGRTGAQIEQVDLRSGHVRLLEDVTASASGSIVSQLTRHSLIDEYQFAVCPVLLGSGQPLVRGVSKQVRLDQLEVKRLPSGDVILRYARTRG